QREVAGKWIVKRDAFHDSPICEVLAEDGVATVDLRGGPQLRVPVREMVVAHPADSFEHNSLVDRPDGKAADQLSDKPHRIGHRYWWTEASSHDPKELAEHLS